jgi:putative ATPase
VGSKAVSFFGNPKRERGTPRCSQVTLSSESTLGPSLTLRVTIENAPVIREYFTLSALPTAAPSRECISNETLRIHVSVPSTKHLFRSNPGHAMNLFERQERQTAAKAEPLASRMRPRTIDEFTGQTHFLAPGKLLWRMLQADRLGSMIFYGPPGCGKTSLAELIAAKSQRHFTRLNAVASGVKELRQCLDEARDRLSASGRQSILFVDEIHRFNRSQQDGLLPDVERGVVTLIGATTENPFFSVVSPLVSRSQVFQFQPLSRDEIAGLLRRALGDTERGLGARGHAIEPAALAFLAEICDGDARRALMGLEIAALSLEPGEQITLAVAEESIQQKALVYDGTGDEHYDAASALIKSIRGSDPDAAIYWLARMIEAGEDPRFLARRIVIVASEDIGNADPHGLVLAQAAASATEFVGLPEARIILTQAVAYLALAPKSNAAIRAIDTALSDVRQQRTLPVPVALRDKHYAGAKQLGHGAGYKYPHDAEDGFVVQDYLGVDKEYYQPVNRGFEVKLGERLAEFRRRRREAADSTHAPDPQTDASAADPTDSDGTVESR